MLVLRTFNAVSRRLHRTLHRVQLLWVRLVVKAVDVKQPALDALVVCFKLDCAKVRACTLTCNIFRVSIANRRLLARRDSGASNIQCCLPKAATVVPTGGNCGVYNGARITQIQGNGNKYFGVTPIARAHLTNPSTFGKNPTTTDNTMLMSTACAFNAMNAAAAKAGVSLRINSGFRTLKRQQYFYNCYRNRNCNNGNLAAVPGRSNHGIGLALDLNIGTGVYTWLRNNAHKYGFVRTVPRENWHWEHRPGWRRTSYT